MRPMIAAGAISRATRPDKKHSGQQAWLHQKGGVISSWEGNLTGTKWGARGPILSPSPLPPVPVASDSTISHLKYGLGLGGAGDNNTRSWSQGHPTSQLEERDYRSRGAHGLKLVV